MLDEVDVFFQKIKFKHLGKQGIINLNYDGITGRFGQGGNDSSNWLVSVEQEKINFYEPEGKECPF
jgi:hypothetical protein